MSARTVQHDISQTYDFYFGNGQCDNAAPVKKVDSFTVINPETSKPDSDFFVMKNPVSTEKAFKNFGLLLGIFTPAAIFLRVLADSGNFRNDDTWFLGILAIVNLATAITGYFSGGLISRMIRYAENQSTSAYLLLLPFIGIVWGLMAGAAGGTIIFVFGAFFGAILGALVGAVALPIFAVLYRIFGAENYIENRLFLPLAFGVTLTVCAFILGL